MSRRGRIVWFGGAGGLVLAGAVCAVLVADGLGQILALVLIGLGLVLATALVFYEVGLSEDRERAREEAAARRQAERAATRRGTPGTARRRGFDRMRGRRRRLQ